MDLQADEAGLHPDPSVTAVFQQPLVSSRRPSGSQGQLFADAYPTYADTDKIPAVASVRRARRPRAARWLRVTVVLVALVVLAAGAALVLVHEGVIDKSGGSGSTTQTSSAGTASHPSSSVPKTPLVSQVATGAGTETYKVNVPAYTVTVNTTTGRSWVSIGVTGQTPAFEGIVNANSSQKELVLGSSQVDVGAGGTSVVVTSGRRSANLTPPSAPFSYQFLVKS
jgi:hypothetical protein